MTRSVRENLPKVGAYSRLSPIKEDIGIKSYLGNIVRRLTVTLPTGSYRATRGYESKLAYCRCRGVSTKRGMPYLLLDNVMDKAAPCLLYDADWKSSKYVLQLLQYYTEEPLIHHWYSVPQWSSPPTMARHCSSGLNVFGLHQVVLILIVPPNSRSYIDTEAIVCRG